MLGAMMNISLTLTPIFERAGKLFGNVESVSRLPDRSLHRSSYGAFERLSGFRFPNFAFLAGSLIVTSIGRMIDMTADARQLDRVRERFTRTAQQFAAFSLAKRSAEAEKLVALAAPRGDEAALDLACGPGTFTRAFAPRVRRNTGLDLTPALMGHAQAAAAQAGLTNTAFACGTATALPFADGSLDLVTCGYSVHHFGEPAAALREVTRVLRAGGRLALMDMIVPGEVSRVAGEANNGIERVRDASHETTFFASGLRGLVEGAGLRVAAEQVDERTRSFDDWMQIAGWQRGDGAYQRTRALMEAAIPGDLARFHTRAIPGSTDLEFVQTSLLLVADKP